MREVLSYLEYNVNMPYKVSEVQFYNKLMEGFENSTEFYSQPFSPELIEKYFEGGSKNTIYASGYNMNNQKIIIFHPNIKQSFSIQDCKKSYGMEFYYPSTLDRFICHCQDAGIKLYWKEVKG